MERFKLNIDRPATIINNLMIEDDSQIDKITFINQWGSMQYPDPELLKPFFDPQKDGN